MDRFERFEHKLDHLTDTVQQTVVNTAANTASLNEHMSQTAEVRKQTQMLYEGLLEMKTELVSYRQDTKDGLAAHKIEIQAQIEPLQTWFDRIKFYGQASAILFTIAMSMIKMADMIFHFTQIHH